MNAKHHEKIAERCRENGALYIDEFDYPKSRSREMIAVYPNPPTYPIFTRDQIEAIRRINDEVQQKIRARLKDERIAVIKLNDQRRPDLGEDWYLPTLSQAIERWKFWDWEILNMDDTFGGLLVRDGYLLVSEMRLREIGISEIPMQ